jgi:hypothetical protein
MDRSATRSTSSGSISADAVSPARLLPIDEQQPGRVGANYGHLRRAMHPIPDRELFPARQAPYDEPLA